MKFKEFFEKHEVAIILFVWWLFWCAWGVGNIFLLHNKQPERQPFTTCIEGKVYIDKPDGVFVVLDNNGDPLLCEKDADILPKK